MQEKNVLPLLSIFQNSNIKENIYSENINTFFTYLNDEKIPQENKVLTINEFTKIIKINRYISEYFSVYEEESIYLFLFKIFLNDLTKFNLKEAILGLLDELRINIEANKSVYDFIFQSLSEIYRKEENIPPGKMTLYLTLLQSILGETENIIKPRNYFSCFGNCKFELNIDKKNKLDVGYSLTFIINFKIGNLSSFIEKENKEIISNLMKIKFSNGYQIDFDLKYPIFLIVKKYQNSYIKTFPHDEWINLIINIMIDNNNNPTLYFFVNGENRMTPFKLPTNSFTNSDSIESISFFNNFYGEVSSIIMLSHKEKSPNVNTSEFLSFFKQYKEGFWKMEKLEELIEKLKKVDSVRKNTTTQPKNLMKLYDNKVESTSYLYDDLTFVFTPFSASFSQKGIIENCLSDTRHTMKYIGNIRLHNYICYQNKLPLIGIIPNIIPIAEMFITKPNIFNEINFEIFLRIIENILKNRKYNIDSFKELKIFQILSLFIEKYPRKYFTDDILRAFIDIGIAIFSTENLCPTYFKYILLNEKIITKYNEKLQISFWEKLMLFCRADKTQMEKFFQMNRLCLILRYYDRNKYNEMCCKKHLFEIKGEYIGCGRIMNPSMNKILLGIKSIMEMIISGTEPKNAICLFKLLTLDLSPCLTQFIINIFLTALESEKTNDNWKNNFVIELINSKFEIIMINTFIHSLLEVRRDLLILIYELHKRLTTMHKGSSKIIEKMLKTCLIPQNMFYFPKNSISSIKENESNDNNDNNDKINDIDDINDSALEKNVGRKTRKYALKRNEELIFKEKVYEQYKDTLLKIFTSWSFGKGLDLDSEYDSYDIKQNVLKNVNILEILVICVEKFNDIEFTFKYLQFLELVVDKEQNAYNLLLNKKFISLILDLSFNNFKSDDKLKKNIYNRTKSLITNIFNNTISYLEKSRIIYPFDEIDTSLLLWGDRIVISESNNIDIKEKLFDFLDDLLLEILTSFKVKFEPKMQFIISIAEFDPKSNFYLKNYLILLTHLFRFTFQYKYDSIILSEGISSLTFSKSINSVLELYISSMRMNNLKGDNISKQWAEYPFFDDIYKRLSNIWGKNNTFKTIITEKKINKLLEYQEYFQKLIMDKGYKNMYLKELIILTYEETQDNKEYIIPLIKIISTSLMCVLSASINNKDFKHWLKQFKYFIRFLIIASTNLIRTDQLDFYNSVQEKVVNVLISSLTFLKDLISVKTQYQEKVEKTYKRILLLCFLIMKYQYQYEANHKIKLFKKMAKSDLGASAVFMLFSSKIKDKNGNPLINLEKANKISLNDYDKVCDGMRDKEWDEALYENQNIKNQLESNYFCLKGYTFYVEKRYKLFQMIKDEYDIKYKKDILLLLPLYENELAKDSNNSLENNKKIKNYYKKYKKESFSWKGYWSDRKLFYENSEKLKLKIINHYTKSFMKPVLSPILDMSYYLPEFSGFDPETLFNKDNNDQGHNNTLVMDMDKILKITEQNNPQSNTSKKKNNENFLRNIYVKSNPELAQNLQKISNNLDFGKEEEFAILEKSKNSKNDDGKKNMYFLACLVKPSHHIKGVFFIEEDEIYFKVFLNQKTGNAMNDVEVAFKTTDDDYDHSRQTCFGSYFICHPKDKDLYKLSINYNNIKFLFKRRYYYKNSAMEIFTSTNKTYYFNFKYEKDRETVVNEIVNKIKEYARFLVDLKEYKDINDIVVGYQNTLILKARKKNGKKKYKIKLSKKLLAWKEWKMSTFELIMWLNIYSNRSYNDISQYPVFPWIITNYEDSLKKDSKNYEYRDLSLPMGMMELNEEGEKRKMLFLETFDILKNEPDESIKPYIYGSNYSNPMFVCNFMMRLFPFTHISIELQGNKFDDANRLFLSVKSSFYNSITQKTDVRELIPEFFYLPEIFININDLNMGVEDNGNKVNDVLTPCNNNPYEFVSTMRAILEDDHISSHIQGWFDLIFGFKSKGKEAELANNVFTEASYQEDVNINDVEDKQSFLRGVEFGLIPSQIMTKECSKREKKEIIIKDKQIVDESAKLIFSMLKDNEQNKEIFKDDVLLLKAKSSSLDRLTLILNNNLIIEKKIGLSLLSNDFTDEIIYKIDLGKEMNKISDFYFNNSINNKVFEICNKGKLIIMGGFCDGKVKIYFLGSESNPTVQNYIELTPFKEDSAIVAISVDKDEEYLLLGNNKGNIALYKMNIEEKKIDKLIVLSSQLSSISHVDCNSELNLWVSTSIDGYINLYTLPLCKLVRSIKVQTQKCSYAFLISSPIPSIVVICDEGRNSNIYVYSINGKLLSQKTENFQLGKPIIIRDSNFNEYMAYLGKDSVCIVNIPNLELIVEIDGIMDAEMLFTNEDMTILYVFNKTGSEITLIRDEEKRNIRAPSFMVKNLVNLG